MINVKPYKDLTSIEKKARDNFKHSRCNGCFMEKNCTTEILAVCLNAYCKGFVKGIKYNRQVIKNKNK